MAATLARSGPMLARIREAGFPVALAAQNGARAGDMPWDEFDVLFLGGFPECVRCGCPSRVSLREQPRCPYCGHRMAEWKLRAAARELAREAIRRGKRVHMGRVNSLRRMRYALSIGCSSADGTFLRNGPDILLPELLGWMRDVNDQGVLWCPSG